MSEQHGFFDTGQRNMNFPFDFEDFSGDKNELRGVNIKRGVLFFHEEQKGITILKLKRFFTDRAISRLEHDGYIEVESLEEKIKNNKSKKSKKK